MNAFSRNPTPAHIRSTVQRRIIEAARAIEADTGKWPPVGAFLDAANVGVSDAIHQFQDGHLTPPEDQQ